MSRRLQVSFLPGPAQPPQGMLPGQRIAGIGLQQDTSPPKNTGLSDSSPATKKNGGRAAARREPALVRDALFVIRRGSEHHVIAESYSYKTEPYYTILSLENEGKQVRPASSAVLDAYVIPVCLERARAAGIPVCDWGISQAYVPLPVIVYGLNYFASNDEFAIIRDNASAKDAIRHVTNNGKYPFCFQRFPEGSEVTSCVSVFGKTCGTCAAMAEYAEKVYNLFFIPLVRMVLVKTGGTYALSSLSPLRYSLLSDAERSLLTAYLSSQEFL